MREFNVQDSDKILLVEEFLNETGQDSWAWELLETMRNFAHEAQEMVSNTPSAAELKKLYERDEH